MARPVIALLTDFGLRDHYVGTMKGVVLGICPDATLVDISHDVPRTTCSAARSSSPRPTATFRRARSFSWSSIPASGSSRRGIAAEAGDYRFVAPDNGVLSVVFDELPPARVVELTDAATRGRPSAGRSKGAIGSRRRRRGWRRASS